VNYQKKHRFDFEIMKKLLLIIVLVLALSVSISSQNVRGKEIRNRDIEWSDFSGDVDQSSKHDAYTFWMTTYNFTSPIAHGDNVRISLTVRLFLDSVSWVKPDKRSARLLNHERGHYRIGRICANELERVISSTDFSRYNYRKEIDVLYWKIIDKYREINDQYDSDTAHYQNVEQQIFWDRKLESLLNGR